MTHKVFEKAVRIRFSHCDPAGIVYHPEYFRLLNELQEEFLHEVIGMGFIEVLRFGLGFPVAGVKCDFAAPSRVGDDCVARLWLERLGTTSMRFAFTIHSDGELRLKCVETNVCVKQTADGKLVKSPIPEELLAKLREYLTDETLTLRA